MYPDIDAYQASPALAALAEDYFQAHLTWSPLFASSLGYHAFDHDVGDPSRAARRGHVAKLETFETRLAVLDREPMNRDDRITRSILRLRLRHEREYFAAALDDVAVSGAAGGELSAMLMFLPQTVLSNVDQAQAYLSRLAALGPYFDSLTRRHREDKAGGRYPTASGVRTAISQLDQYMAGDARADPLLTPLRGQLEGLDGWRTEAEVTLTDVVRPALRRLRAVWAEELLPVGRDDGHVGICHVPGGREGYEAAVRLFTTTDLSAEEIHRSGLACVHQIRLEISELGAQVFGTDDVATIFARLRNDASLHFDSAGEIVGSAEEAYRRAQQALGGWFRDYDIPACDIREIEPHQAPSAPAGYYMWPSVDGKRAGAFWINTYEPSQRSRIDLENVTFHETLPGHHLHGIVGASAELPSFRRYRRSVAHTEGWGLYAERLADEMGLYTSALARLGMLSYAALRACRLVVDTGMHYFSWSREQVVSYLRENTAQPDIAIDAETERYINMPGQALAYMIGQLHIEGLRARASEALGEIFNIAEFHHAIIAEGSVPLATLDDLVTELIHDVRHP